MKQQLPQKNLFSTPAKRFVIATLFIAAIFGLATGTVLAKEQPSSSPDSTNDSYALGSNNIFNDVFKPYLVKVIDVDSEITTPTTDHSPSSILKNADVSLAPEDDYAIHPNNDLQDEPLVAYRLTIDRATLVTISLYGEVSTIRTQSSNVSELLAELGVKLGSSSHLSISQDTELSNGMTITISRVGTELVTVEEDLEFTRQFVDDKTIPYGTDTVRRAGKNGSALVTYKITYYDNKEAFRSVVTAKTLTDPVVEIVTRGTKGAPYSNGPLSAAQIQFLGNCEAGMNPTRNSGNGYYGAFQFSVGTWNAMNTGYARADLAPLNVQIQAVQQLLSRSSIFGQFPGCANQMVAAGIL